jgi:hypothetical protein
LPRKAAAPEVAAEGAAQDQGLVWAAACRVVAEAQAAQADPEAAAAALAPVVPVVAAAAELMPVICGVLQGRVAAEARAAAGREAALAAPAVEVVQAAELGLVVVAV